MLILSDGRSELWQWDTGRKLTVDADCSQVHFSNKVFGRSIDVDVVDGVAIIPDVLLQTDKELTAWAFVGTIENGYTKISKVFKVNKRNKPADYVFTPTEQTTLEEILDRIKELEENPNVDVDLTGAVLYTKQTLSKEQKAQARENIGAASTEDVISGGGLTTEEKNLIFSLFRDAAYTKPLTGAIEQLAELWGIPLVWQKIIPLEDLYFGYGLAHSETEINGEHKYGQVRDNRVSYLDFIPIKAGATYKFEWDGVEGSLICLEAYNTTVMEAVSGFWGYSDSDRWSSGWNDNQTSGCQITLPSEHNGKPIRAIRITFYSSAPPTGDITITEVVE